MGFGAAIWRNLVVRVFRNLHQSFPASVEVEIHEPETGGELGAEDYGKDNL